MSWPDVVNGSFEAVAAVAAATQVRTLMRDKVVRGVNVPAQIFFAAWGYWNLFYYPSLEQWFSFGGGSLLVGANTLWVLLALHYRRRSS